MSSKGPGLFSEIGKKAKDLLVKDYGTEQKVTLTSYSDAGIALNSTVVKKGGLFSGDVVSQYKHMNAAVDVKVNTESEVYTTFTIIDILPSAKAIASIKLPDYKSGKLEVQYLHEHTSFTSAVTLNQSPAIDFSATIGTPSIAFGAEGSYSTASANFLKYNAGVSLTKPDSTASVILADKGDLLRVSYLRDLNWLNGGTAVGEVTRRFSTNENTLTVGCSYVVDSNTTVKTKLNNNGNLGALLQHRVTPKAFLTVSGAFETLALEKEPKFGLALNLKP
ncbi:Porin type [Parasponia andersonii]|uniref:Porin type n=1 Tax=Parasponia andersonii TaxID=3476 RepID=A0A2P5DI05_PARAD|nr:Porin type [Parasponia andersonii]